MAQGLGKDQGEEEEARLDWRLVWVEASIKIVIMEWLNALARPVCRRSAGQLMRKDSRSIQTDKQRNTQEVAVQGRPRTRTGFGAQSCALHVVAPTRSIPAFEPGGEGASDQRGDPMTGAAVADHH